MKKIIAVFIALLVSTVSVYSLAADYSSMSDDDLRAEFEIIQQEMNNRGIGQGKRILNDLMVCEEMNVLICLEEISLERNASGETELKCVIVMVNNGNNPVTVTPERIVVNGFELSVYNSGSVLLDSAVKRRMLLSSPELNARTNIRDIREIQTLEVICSLKDEVTGDVLDCAGEANEILIPETDAYSPEYFDYNEPEY